MAATTAASVRMSTLCSLSDTVSSRMRTWRTRPPVTSARPTPSTLDRMGTMVSSITFRASFSGRLLVNEAIRKGKAFMSTLLNTGSSTAVGSLYLAAFTLLDMSTRARSTSTSTFISSTTMDMPSAE